MQTLRQCPAAFIAPNFPIWHGHVRFGYFSNQTSMKINADKPHFVCYDKNLCPQFKSTFTFDNYTCLLIDKLNLSSIENAREIFRSCNYIFQTGNETNCIDSTMVRCLGTNKCIPQRRIMNGIQDCYDGFDESLFAKSCALNDKYRFQCTSEQKCLSSILVNNDKGECIGGEDESQLNSFITNIHKLPFSAICDQEVNMLPVINDTDETHCELWPCVNQYTRCNVLWDCSKGIDEINCSSLIQCPANHHPCMLPKNRTLGCLHMDYIDDGIIDCLGSTDERSHCRSLHSEDLLKYYRCWNDTKCVQFTRVCKDCHDFNDMNILCDTSNHTVMHIIQYFLKKADRITYARKPFSHRSSRSFPFLQLSSLHLKQIHNGIIKTEKIFSIQHINDSRLWLCNKGFAILVGKHETEQCLCPENYYGHLCQYQNQRVSLTIRLRQEHLEKFNIIGIVIRLVDHTGFVNFYEQITYIPVIDCNTKYNIHLLYQNRPKDMTKNYTIYIDVYDKVNLLYLTSWIYPVKLLFMPVNRMSVQLIIPTKQDCRLLCSEKYLEPLVNSHMQSCRCSNRANSILTIEHKCNCSPRSICVGLKENRSICLCSLNDTGPRCYLKSICQMNNTCMNQGICIPYDSRHSSTKFTCVCPDGFFGEYCEKTDVRIDISFSDVEIPQSVLVYFINVVEHHSFSLETEPTQVTMFKKIPLKQKTITLYMSLSFHLVFVQIDHMYYLVVLQHNYTSSIIISTQITQSQRCPHIRELLDKVMIDKPLLYVVKYYHTICQKHSDLLCFHDSYTFMCLCTEDRQANCFHFNYNTTYNCSGYNNCQNDARCFQDHPHCSTRIMCVCQGCFYGDKCQLTTQHFGLSLDSILGYHVYPHFTFTQQSLPVKISISLATLLVIIGLVSGILSNLTFQL
ncbi:hypothetical protein I4U23_004287 [Adineta vaga]|nr:hypothetical protein I4U23_004287 [Adineta vaga]